MRTDAARRTPCDMPSDDRSISRCREPAAGRTAAVEPRITDAFSAAGSVRAHVCRAIVCRNINMIQTREDAVPCTHRHLASEGVLCMDKTWHTIWIAAFDIAALPDEMLEEYPVSLHKDVGPVTVFTSPQEHACVVGVGRECSSIDRSR